MKKSRKIVSALLASMMVASMCSLPTTVSAAGSTLTSYYSTNKAGTGANKTISIDGSISDWDSSMLIAQGTANDDPRVYRPNSMYELGVDLYALYGAYDDNNVYLMWEMTNVQDVVAPSDNYPLSQGVLWQTQEFPFFIAVDTGKADTAIGNKGALTTGGTIWNSGMTFENSFNKLISINTKGGNGPWVYGGDSSGLNAKEILDASTSNVDMGYGLGILSKNVYGIDKAYGEYNGRVPGDVCDEGSAWVDFNTLGHSSSTMDFFYELSIPYDELGITKSDVENNGIGVMLVATMGKSPMDCLPGDPVMTDQADLDDAAASQENNSFEKSDEDHITASFARIGKGSSVIPTQPTTQPTQPTTQPTTAPTTQPTTVADPMVVATSNIFPQQKVEMDDTFTVTYDLKSAMKLANGQWTLSYDTEYLSFDPEKNADLMPYINSGDMINTTTGKIYGAFSNLDLYDFSASQPFVEVTFDVKKTIDKAVYVDLQVEELSVGYTSNGQTTFKNAVKNSAVVNLSNVSGFTGSSLSYNTTIDYYQVADTLTVKASSNLGSMSAVSQELDKNAGTVTVTYKLKSTMDIVNGDWVLTYDSNKLKFVQSDNLNAAGTKLNIMPNVTGATINTAYSSNSIRGAFSNLAMYDFSTEKDFVTVTFKVIGKGTANVKLNVTDMSVGYQDSSSGEVVPAAIVKDGKEVDVTSIKGFENQALTGEITFTKTDAPAFLLGDVDGNGDIDIDDATTIQFHLSKATTLDSDALKKADVDGNGRVDIDDVTRLQFFLSKAITSF